MPPPLTIFIHEFLTSGACHDVPLDSSLMNEGKAMADAVIADFAALEGVRVVTSRDARIPAVDRSAVTTSIVSEAGEEPWTFQSLCASSDRVLVIAPETDGILTARLAEARRVNPTGVLNCDSEALTLGSDKWKLFERLTDWRIPVVPSELGQDDVSYPLLVKSRDGAGCEGIQVIRKPAELDNGDRTSIFQPLMDGIALSSAACFNTQGQRMLTLPVGRQLLEIDDSIRYLGGEIPWQHQSRLEAERQAESIWQRLEDNLSGLQGYVGIDWLWDERQQLLRLVEINPRLTTAYAGYRKLFGIDIAASLLGTAPRSEMSPPQGVRFAADGSILSRPAEGALS